MGYPMANNFLSLIYLFHLFFFKCLFLKIIFWTLESLVSKYFFNP